MMGRVLEEYVIELIKDGVSKVVHSIGWYSDKEAVLETKQDYEGSPYEVLLYKFERHRGEKIYLYQSRELDDGKTRIVRSS